MGFNSLLFINNDCMVDIDEHADEWWKRAKRALGTIMGGNPQTFDFRGNVNYNQATWCRQSNVVGLIAVGHNGSAVLTSVYDPFDQVDHSTDDGKLLLLQAAAQELGYRLTKIPKKREPKCQDTLSAGPKPEPTSLKSSSTKTPSKTKKKPSKKDSKPSKRKGTKSKSSTAKS